LDKTRLLLIARTPAAVGFVHIHSHELGTFGGVDWAAIAPKQVAKEKQKSLHKERTLRNAAANSPFIMDILKEAMQTFNSKSGLV
jgi:hypothetical protein